MDQVPKIFKERIFFKVFDEAEIAKFTPAQANSYEDSLKYYRDLKNTLDTAFDDGVEQGIERGIEQGFEQGIVHVAIAGLKQGKSDTVIMELTGLSQQQLNSIRDKHNLLILQ